MDWCIIAWSHYGHCPSTSRWFCIDCWIILQYLLSASSTATQSLHSRAPWVSFLSIGTAVASVIPIIYSKFLLVNMNLYARPRWMWICDAVLLRLPRPQDWKEGLNKRWQCPMSWFSREFVFSVTCLLWIQTLSPLSSQRKTWVLCWNMLQMCPVLFLWCVFQKRKICCEYQLLEWRHLNCTCLSTRLVQTEPSDCEPG